MTKIAESQWLEIIEYHRNWLQGLISSHEFFVKPILAGGQPIFSVSLPAFESPEAIIARVGMAMYCERAVSSSQFQVLNNSCSPGTYDFFGAHLGSLTHREKVGTSELFICLESLGFCQAPIQSAFCLCEQKLSRHDKDYFVISEPLQLGEKALFVITTADVVDVVFMVPQIGIICGNDDQWLWEDRVFVCRKRPEPPPQFIP